MNAPSWLGVVVGLSFMVGFGWLLAKNWQHRPLRNRLIGNILLVAILPASIIVPHDNLLLTFGVAGALLGAGLAFRIAAERAGVF